MWGKKAVYVISGLSHNRKTAFFFFSKEPPNNDDGGCYISASFTERTAINQFLCTHVMTCCPVMLASEAAKSPGSYFNWKKLVLKTSSFSYHSIFFCHFNAFFTFCYLFLQMSSFPPLSQFFCQLSTLNMASPTKAPAARIGTAAGDSSTSTNDVREHNKSKIIKGVNKRRGKKSSNNKCPGRH